MPSPTTDCAVDAVAGPLVLHLEAASNPMFPSYTPSHLGSLDTAGDRLLYRFREASLVVVDAQAEALAYDIEVLDGVMRALHLDDPRRARLQRVLAEALDRISDVDAARRERLRRRWPRTSATLFVTVPSPSAMRTSTPPGCGRSARPSARSPGRSQRPSRSWTTTRSTVLRFVGPALHVDRERHPELFAKIVECVERAG